MATAKIVKTEEVSIVSAIETLSNIADLELSSTLQDPLMIASPPREAPVMVKTVRWLHQKNAEHMHTMIREKLHVVLDYLQHFYASEKERFVRKESLEGIRTIMMLVDEASENLDRYTKLFLGAHGTSIKTTKEFLDLCDFYTTKILPIAVHSKVSSLIGALPITEIFEKVGVRPPQWSSQVAYAPLTVDLESIQKDVDYELLFIRRADGSRFFTPKLLRSMRLVCDIEQAVDWQGRGQLQMQIDALKKAQAGTEVNYLLGTCYSLLDTFMHAAHRAKDHQLVLDLYAPCIALMMAGLQSIHRPGEPQVKGICEYCNDFRSLFNKFIHSREFQRLLTYPSVNEQSWEYALLKLTEKLSSSIIDGAPMSQEFVNDFKDLLVQGMSRAEEQVGAPDGSLSRFLSLNFAALRTLVGTQGNTTPVRMLHQMETQALTCFEPLVGESLPTHLFTFLWGEDLIPVVRLPSPTKQEMIDAAVPSEVFQIAARRNGRKIRKFLVVNLQDRTGWKDGARCQAIEEMARGDNGTENVSVFSLTRDGDFYHQEGSYEEQSEAERFKEELLDHMSEPARGVLFPLVVASHIGAELKELIDALHKHLYGGSDVLPRAQRIEIIDFVHLLLILRVIEEVHPDIIFMSCKDGLDTSLVTLGSLFSFLKLINRRLSSGEEMDWLSAMLLGLPLIQRDRTIFADCYARMTSQIRFLEGITQDEREAENVDAIRAITKFLPREILYAAMVPASGHQLTYFDRRYPI